MSIYRKLDPTPEHRTQFAFKSKREHITNVKIPNIAYPNQHIDTETTHGSRDKFIVPGTVKITFDFDRQNSTGKTGKTYNELHA